MGNGTRNLTTVCSSALLFILGVSVLKSGARFGNCEMEWAQESVIELIELYKRHEMRPKAPNAF
jgi:hypothetical protein